MKVFISWSGPRSKAVAEALSSWLRKVIQAAEPWISIDIEKGARWSPEIAEQLEQSNVGIFCLTRENLNAPWILFEAGAISKKKGAHVCTFLLDLAAADVEPPLGQFQHTSRDKNDVLSLLKTINGKIESHEKRGLTENLLEEIFERFWADLSTPLDLISKKASGSTSERRSDREVLEEILEAVRNQDRRLAAMEAQQPVPVPGLMNLIYPRGTPRPVGAAAAALGLQRTPKGALQALLEKYANEQQRSEALAEFAKLAMEQDNKED